jgi:2-polyprenyl-3-methyl-5-hydroxy-6-metoxy-1,4-benzoquinol methylase
MIQEILQKNTIGLRNERSEECIGYEYNDAIIPNYPYYHQTYFPLAKKLNETFPNTKYILELGCGAGNLASHYRQINPSIVYVTLDINADIINNGLINPNTHFTVFTDRPYQLTENNKNLKFDLILSYEHFEHIPESNVNIFLKNIKNHCHENTIIVATSAIITRDVHPITWDKNKWADVLNENGFLLLENQILEPHIVPFNFQFQNSVELIFKLAA